MPTRDSPPADTAPADTAPAPSAGVAAAPARIAVVGAGPAGCYTAQALRRRLPDARITVIDRLPVPYGLIRYGVAADHQGTKGVTRQFARLFERGGVEFLGNVTVGAEVTLDALRAAFDAVVLAHGLHRDRPLPADGATLPGVHGSGEITRLLNAHPDGHRPAPELGRTVAVIGCGNVAMDLVRLLTKPEPAFAGSDVDDAARERLTGRVRTVHVIGRGAPGTAKFDPILAREIADRDDLTHLVHGRWQPVADDPAGQAREEIADELSRRGCDAATEGTAAELPRVEWWFGTSVLRCVGDGAVHALDVAVDGGRRRIDVDSVITAIGFEAAPTERLVDITDSARDTGRIAPGLYVAGWARTGPHGTIAQQRTAARALAALIVGELAARRRTARPGFAAPAGATTYRGWRRIDAHERRTAAAHRVRRKVGDRGTLLALARTPADA